MPQDDGVRGLELVTRRGARSAIELIRKSAANKDLGSEDLRKVRLHLVAADTHYNQAFSTTGPELDGDNLQAIGTYLDKAKEIIDVAPNKPGKGEPFWFV
ncbi:MAG: hypothetical protein ACLQVG_23225 [Terriglobia bacterium]